MQLTIVVTQFVFEQKYIAGPLNIEKYKTIT